MKIKWWKLAAIVILVYVILAGFIVPLKPGIMALSPRSGISGTQLEIEIVGYNSHFESAESSMRAWLKIDSLYGIPSNAIFIDDEMHARLRFDIPANLPGRDSLVQTSLLVDNSIDKTFVYPGAVIISNLRLGQEIPGVDPLDRIPLNELDILGGFRYPYRNILHETIRNTFFHISLWFSMFILLFAAMIYSIRVLRRYRMRDDIIASALTKVSILYGLLGIATGSIWAKFTWGTFWTNDVKLNMVVIAMLIYLAYIILRHSIEDLDKRAKLCAVFNIFAYAALIPLVFVIPRLTSSLHPGSGGNPALGGEDLDNTLRMVFYPSILGLTLLGLWIAQIRIKLDEIRYKIRLKILTT